MGRYLLPDTAFGARILLPAERPGGRLVTWQSVARGLGRPDPDGRTSWRSLVELPGDSSVGEFTPTLTPATGYLPPKIGAELVRILRSTTSGDWMTRPEVGGGLDASEPRPLAVIVEECIDGQGPEFAWAPDGAAGLGLPRYGDSVYISAHDRSILDALFACSLECHGVWAADLLPFQGDE